eukprot:scaffold4357_cov79-Cylindrotheca_fusiformis.AAC.1
MPVSRFNTHLLVFQPLLLAVLARSDVVADAAGISEFSCHTAASCLLLEANHVDQMPVTPNQISIPESPRGF